MGRAERRGSVRGLGSTRVSGRSSHLPEIKVRGPEPTPPSDLEVQAPSHFLPQV